VMGRSGIGGPNDLVRALESKIGERKENSIKKESCLSQRMDASNNNTRGSAITESINGEGRQRGGVLGKKKKREGGLGHQIRKEAARLAPEDKIESECASGFPDEQKEKSNDSCDSLG